MKAIVYLLGVLVVIFSGCQPGNNSQDVQYKPVIEGDWWSIAGNPDLGPCTSEDQQPVDYGIWQAADGTWQLWSCIRHTHCGEHTRLFYRWESPSLTKPDWTPKGIAMQADTTLGEQSGGLQAPYVHKEDGTYYMFYGDWHRICLATSEDGKNFERKIFSDGTPALFEGPWQNTRDPMVIKEGGTYYCYYTDHVNDQNEDEPFQAAIFCRTSGNMVDWSEPRIVSAGGSPEDQDNWYGGDSECPFVLPYQDKYLLFRNQRYGENLLNTQYCSSDPLNFGVDNDSLMVGTLQVAAPEIIEHEGRYYIASLKPTLDGIRMARARFERE